MFFSILLVFSLPAAAQSVKPENPAPQPVNVTPHKALYEISLESARSGSQIANIHGQMFYEWANDCDAWTSNHSFNLVYEYTDNPPMRVSSDFSTFETYDGKTLSYTSQRKQDGKLFEEIRGQAELTENADGKAHFTIPAELVYDLPKGTLFPMAHTLETLEKIQEGKRFYNATIFDGSDDDGPTEVNAFIGKRVTPTEANASEQAANKNIAHELLKSPAHDIRMAFFPINDQSSTSDYEMNITLHENSVISDMHIEYEDFTVKQKLIALQPLENVCAQNKQKAQDEKAQE